MCCGCKCWCFQRFLHHVLCNATVGYMQPSLRCQWQLAGCLLTMHTSLVSMPEPHDSDSVMLIVSSCVAPYQAALPVRTAVFEHSVLNNSVVGSNSHVWGKHQDHWLWALTPAAMRWAVVPVGCIVHALPPPCLACAPNAGSSSELLCCRELWHVPLCM